MTFQARPSVPWYERSLALAGAVSMTVLAALALWAVMAGVALPGIEASVAASAAAAPAASTTDPALHSAGTGAWQGLALTP